MPQVKFALSEETHRELKILAAKTGTTLAKVFASACTDYIKSQAKKSR